MNDDIYWYTVCRLLQFTLLVTRTPSTKTTRAARVANVSIMYLVLSKKSHCFEIGNRIETLFSSVVCTRTSTRIRHQSATKRQQTTNIEREREREREGEPRTSGTTNSHHKHTTSTPVTCHHHHHPYQ